MKTSGKAASQPKANGDGPERLFDNAVHDGNAETAVVRRRLGERVKSTLCCLRGRPYERTVSARKRSSAEGESCVE
jgi:hypothetical protein